MIDIFETISFFIAGSFSARASSTSIRRVVLEEQRVDRLLPDLGRRVGRVDRLDAPRRCRLAPISPRLRIAVCAAASGSFSLFASSISLSALPPTNIAWMIRFFTSTDVSVDRARRARRARPSRRAAAPPRRAARRRSRSWPAPSSRVPVAGHHEAADDRALHRRVGRRAVDVGEHLPVVVAAHDARGSLIARSCRSGLASALGDVAR